MIIIAGYELVNAKDRDGYVAAFRGLVSRAREGAFSRHHRRLGGS